jgi:hypothetical protein
MKDAEIQDGTWTHRAMSRKAGVWSALIFEPWVTDTRFRRARFILDGGATVLVSAEDLRRVVAGTNRRGKLVIPLRIDKQKSTINGQTVELHEESNERPGVDAGWPLLFAFSRAQARANQAERSARK